MGAPSKKTAVAALLHVARTVVAADIFGRFILSLLEND
jgi:hypothetical protein